MQAMYGILIMGLVMAIWTNRNVQNETIIMEEKQKVEYIKEVSELIDLAIDPKIGYTSRRNSSCSNLGYWNDITAVRLAQCLNNNNFDLNFTGSGDADERTPEMSYFYWDKSGDTLGNIKVYFKNHDTDDKKFEILVDVSALEEDDRIVSANKYASYISKKYKKYISDVNVEATDLVTNGGNINDGIIRITFEI